MQYADATTAATAKQHLDGHCMYPDHANRVRLVRLARSGRLPPGPRWRPARSQGSPPDTRAACPPALLRARRRRQLLCHFSTHRDLLIRQNAERSWDYTKAPGGPAAAAAASGAAAAAAGGEPSPGAGAPAQHAAGTWAAQAARGGRPVVTGAIARVLQGWGHCSPRSAVALCAPWLPAVDRCLPSPAAGCSRPDRRGL